MNTKPFRPARPVDMTLTPLSDLPDYAELLRELQELEQLHADKEAGRRRLLARARGAKVKRSAAERAKDLLAGGRVDAIPVGSQIAGIDEELMILRDAIGEKTRALDAVARDAAFEESMKLQPEFLSLMRDALAGMEAALAAFGRASNIAGQLQAAGYRVSSNVMPDLMPYGFRQVQADGLKQFRRALSEMGAL